MSGSERRVVVTGFGGITALGHDWPTIERALRGNVSGIVRMGAWDRYPELNTRLGGRNFYWDDSDGHNWEVLTVSYARSQPSAVAGLASS